MNDENKKLLWKLIQATGDFLVNKLPDHPSHPKGRNPYAHVALRVKTHFGKSYKDLSDSHFNEVVDYLELIKKEEG
tara:strand:+ start:416 stop:643 length:228 start_codon:yes stop_codon:yes gene_type:complete